MKKKKYNHLLLHIPHSSVVFPVETKFGFKDLNDEKKLLVDYFTDELFVPCFQTRNIHSVVFPFCRLYCDVERMVNDPLEHEGLGISYRKKVCSGCLPFEERCFSTLKEAFDYYVDFYALVSKKLFGLGESTLLIDCHSFSALPNLLNSAPPDIDICIGFNDDETCPDKVIIGNIVQYFKSLGYKVGMNEPFSNSKTFNVPMHYHSVMIEVNKGLYMDENTLKKSEGFEKLKQDIQSLYRLIIKTM